MSHPFEVTEDADPHVKNINEHLRTTDQLLVKMENEVQEMVNLNWHGNQSQMFHNRMVEHLDHMRQIQAQTDRLATSSMEYIQAHRNIDA
ncbi:hypothetical protein [Mycobacterium asiaticum]|uniref:ESAT-6-like protein n=1 Tax=Mycobacterium asiaticum TaxID=1790 RepID=A0A1A3N9J9_MYCAS|nr:hypothetical protein [Mycobacterium asiaticum]OBK18456.1 hypothetical protein A5636_20830 [Mycobacterium asiaticum]